MKLADKISRLLIQFIRSGNSDVIVPNFYHGLWEMDVFRLTPSQIIYEYEIKISRSDFKNDFKKAWGENNKHQKMINKTCKCNRFYFVVPKDLVSVSEIPSYAGLIYYKDYKDYGSFEIVKTAPMIHKNKEKNAIDMYRSLSIKLAFREAMHKGKSNYWKNRYDELKQLNNSVSIPFE